MPLRILAFDGGGYRGLASLLILRQILTTLVGTEKAKRDPIYPYKYFDLIAGTSAGGLSALMLGRLQMDIDSAIEAYKQLGPFIFGNDNGVLRGIIAKGHKLEVEEFVQHVRSWLQGDSLLYEPDQRRVG